ncbi:MAG: hypothetical protein IKX67_06380 [Bacteroidales bacterium]|nr:hypothetical protein [Bacteroidales bacterium]
MKTYHLLGFALIAATTFLSCSNIERDVIQNDSIKEKQREVIITASIESQPETRTVLDSDYQTILWNPSDYIKVFSAGEAAKFTSQNTSRANTAQFKGSISVITATSEQNPDASYIYGLYPYQDEASFNNGSITTTLPDTQSGFANSFADDLFISIGRSLTFSMGFWNVCSGFRFRFSVGGYQSVTLSSNDGTPFAGTFVVSFDSSGKPTITAYPAPSPSVTVNAPEGGFTANKWYYIVTLPGYHAGGYTLEASNAWETGIYQTTEPKTFTRSRFKEIDNLDQRLSFPAAVDLGLSVKWAAYNLGATKPEEYGDYFAWGEMEPYYKPGYAQSSSPVWKDGKSEGYWWKSYRWCNNAYNKLTKYNDDDEYGYNGFTDNKLSLDIEDDAARSIAGRTWRMPTKAELQELKSNCTWSASTVNGVKGLKATGPNGNSIFFPAAGYWTADEKLYKGQSGYYLSSSLANTPCYPFSLWIKFDTVYSGYETSFNRCAGFSIRPVIED